MRNVYLPIAPVLSCLMVMMLPGSAWFVASEPPIMIAASATAPVLQLAQDDSNNPEAQQPDQSGSDYSNSPDNPDQPSGQPGDESGDAPSEASSPDDSNTDQPSDMNASPNDSGSDNGDQNSQDSNDSENPDSSGNSP